MNVGCDALQEPVRQSRNVIAGRLSGISSRNGEFLRRCSTKLFLQIINKLCSDIAVEIVEYQDARPSPRYGNPHYNKKNKKRESNKERTRASGTVKNEAQREQTNEKKIIKKKRGLERSGGGRERGREQGRRD